MNKLMVEVRGEYRGFYDYFCLKIKDFKEKMIDKLDF